MSGWIITDDDSMQCIRAHDDGVTFDLMEIRAYSSRDAYVGVDTITVSDDVMDIEDVCLCISSFGYKNIDEIRELYGDSWRQIIAEMIFEEYPWRSESIFSGSVKACEAFIRNKCFSDAGASCGS